MTSTLLKLETEWRGGGSKGRKKSSPSYWILY